VDRRADPQGRQLHAGGADAAGSVRQLNQAPGTPRRRTILAMAHSHAHTPAPGHTHQHGPSRETERGPLKAALALILAFMVAEVTVGVLASSLALLSDAAHMLTDAAALGLALGAARLASRPAGGPLTYGLGRAEILSAQANGVTLLVLAAVIVYGAITRLVSPPAVQAGPVLAVALVGVAVNLAAARILSRGAPERSLNAEGSFQHILTDLYGFLATAVAAGVILATGFSRADPIASLLIAALMLYAAGGLLKASGRVFMEAAPAGLDPNAIGTALAEQPGVVQVHDLHVWEVTSGFPALSAHVVVRAGDDCHERRRNLQLLLQERFGVQHTTLQVDHDAAPQAPLQIEIVADAPASGQSPPGRR
jgi:cobalt-zinc-cadmium efflux system protein